MMPSRMKIRMWLATLTRDQILAELAEIKREHGVLGEQDVREILNHERELVSQGFGLMPDGEANLLNFATPVSYPT